MYSHRPENHTDVKLRLTRVLRRALPCKEGHSKSTRAGAAASRGDAGAVEDARFSWTCHAVWPLRPFC